jgi:hypothetical protein
MWAGARPRAWIWALNFAAICGLDPGQTGITPDQMPA